MPKGPAAVIDTLRTARKGVHTGPTASTPARALEKKKKLCVWPHAHVDKYPRLKFRELKYHIALRRGLHGLQHTSLYSTVMHQPTMNELWAVYISTQLSKPSGRGRLRDQSRNTYMSDRQRQTARALPYSGRIQGPGKNVKLTSWTKLTPAPRVLLDKHSRRRQGGWQGRATPRVPAANACGVRRQRWQGGPQTSCSRLWAARHCCAFDGWRATSSRLPPRTRRHTEISGRAVAAGARVPCPPFGMHRAARRSINDSAAIGEWVPLAKRPGGPLIDLIVCHVQPWQATHSSGPFMRWSHGQQTNQSRPLLTAVLCCDASHRAGASGHWR